MSAFFWIVIGVVFLLLLGGSKGKSVGKSDSRNQATRVDRMHYCDQDDYECTVCGARFQGKNMVCPKCGAKFKQTKALYDEFDEELDFWEDDD